MNEVLKKSRLKSDPPPLAENPVLQEPEEEEEEEERSYQSESENERPGSDESDDSASDEDFDDGAAQNCFDTFMVSLPKWIRKTLAVSLMYYFQKRQKLNVKDSALESAYITGFNEKTIRNYRNDFFLHKGKFSDSKQGKYKRWCLFNDEDIRLKASSWVRENAQKKREANKNDCSFLLSMGQH